MSEQDESEPDSNRHPARYLDCDHCGDVAIESDEGFTDGQGTECATCGFPGHVVVDELVLEVWWKCDEQSKLGCRVEDCPECRPEPADE